MRRDFDDESESPVREGADAAEELVRQHEDEERRVGARRREVGIRDHVVSELDAWKVLDVLVPARCNKIERMGGVRPRVRCTAHAITRRLALMHGRRTQC